MTLLILFLLLAILVSFFCSVSEAVLLSVRPSYVAALERREVRGAKVLRKLRNNLDRPLAAILTANTVAHTVGAAGVGAQAAAVFGSQYLGLASAILTLLVLVFSEIIPKTLGATYWKELAPSFGMLIDWLTRILYPFVWMSEKLTRLVSRSKDDALSFSREEIEAMAEIGVEEGLIEAKELTIVRNLMRLNRLSVRNIMTPRPVLFSVAADLSVREYFELHVEKPFSRILLYGENSDDIVGYVLKSDLFLAQAQGRFDTRLADFKRDLLVLSNKFTASHAFDRLVLEKCHIALIVDEYGTIHGLVTLEDVLETLIGLEIVDELDKVESMQALAHKRWRERMVAIGIDPDSIKATKP